MRDQKHGTYFVCIYGERWLKNDVIAVKPILLFQMVNSFQFYFF